MSHSMTMQEVLLAKEWARLVRRVPLKQPLQTTAKTDCEEKWDILIHSRQFCSSTSLHGVQYFGEPGRNIFERIFWLGAFVLAMVTAAFLIFDLYKTWDANPVIVSFSASSTPITDIPFPAITICNMNNARRSVAESILSPSADHQTVDVERVLLNDVCNMSLFPEGPRNSTSRKKPIKISPQWDDFRDFMIKVNEPCHELLLKCQWSGETFSCSDLFNSALTDEGLCCVFNRVPRDLLFRNPDDLPDLNITFPFSAFDWSPEKQYPFNTSRKTLPWRPEGAGKHLGLTIILDLELHEYFCSSTASAGLKMLLHNPVESPKMSSFGAAISPGKENFVVIRPELTRSTGKIEPTKVNKRHCFFLHERSLRFYRTYTKHNCAMECEANYTLAKCGCVEYFMPKDKNTRICDRDDDECAVTASADVELHLLDDGRKYKKTTSNANPSCHCLPGCHELTYAAETSSSTLVDTFPANKKYDITSSKINNITYFKDNVVIMHFFFMDMQVVSYEKDERTNFVNFLASTGGLLGLFHGFSVLSAVEVLYFLTIRLLCSWRKHAGKNNHVAAGEKVEKLVPISTTPSYFP
ncbi:pickpocket protein 28-like [Cloeon dipterum]|uniref:pickpocket protein 28-like n=1 Tax=Cloeon dipterum TaxID=197152 RepID=UPI0032203478